MITIKEMLEIIKHKNVYIAVEPADWLRAIGRVDAREQKIRDMYSEKYKYDLIGFEEETELSYRPIFATLQDEWDKELAEFMDRKREWCAKYGCE